MKLMVTLILFSPFCPSAHAFAPCDDGPYCTTKKLASGVEVKECRDHKGVLRHRVEMKAVMAHNLFP